MITVVPDPGGRPGIALVRVAGAAAAAARPGLRVLREGWDNGNLGPNGWQGEDVLLEPGKAATDGADLLLTLGWSICAHLEAGTYIVAVPAACIQEAVIWPDIRPIRAAPRPRPPPPPGATSQPPPVAPIQTVAAGPALTDPIAVNRFKPGANMWSGLLGLALLVLVAGVGVWFVYRPHEPMLAGLAGAPSRPGLANPPSLAAMSVTEVLRQTHDMADVTAEGQRRLANGKADDGLLLLEESADRGGAGAMAALGRLYDPVNFQLGHMLRQPDARQSARYFHDAAQANAPGVEADRQALRDWLQGRAHNGDVTAQLILKDFWQ